jgi:hypothetical protein
MTITLPYAFDTTTTFRGVLKFAAALELVMVIGIFYSMLVRHDVVGVILLVLIGVIVGGFASVMFRHSEGSLGTISRDAVVVERGAAVLGLRFPGPSGRFALTQFAGVRAEEASGPIQPGVQGGPHARIYLTGAGGTPDILIARVHGEGVDAGRAFAAALGLPFQDVQVPY